MLKVTAEELALKRQCSSQLRQQARAQEKFKWELMTGTVNGDARSDHLYVSFRISTVRHVGADRATMYIHIWIKVYYFWLYYPHAFSLFKELSQKSEFFWETACGNTSSELTPESDSSFVSPLILIKFSELKNRKKTFPSTHLQASPSTWRWSIS